MVQRLAIVRLAAAIGVLAACDGDIHDNREPPQGSPLRLIHLWYADGKDPPAQNPLCEHHRPPPFSCTFGSSLASCQAAVQVYLDRWYRDLPVVFTLTAPPSTTPHDTVVISTDGDWCGLVPAGLAPVTCEGLVQGTAWAFSCGDSAERCAAVIAQEHAHLLGLEHTNSPHDLLSMPICRDCVGFEDKENDVVLGRCRRVQNSFELINQRIGSTHQ
jgi:hypothetical protein